MPKLLLFLCLSTPFLGFAQDPTGWWNESVFYEIFVRSFYDSDGDGVGDFNGITAKLDYLNDNNPATTSDLGINAIWLMPIHPSPSYHGYDVTDYYGINPDYGTMADFQNFLTEAHNRGIKVIIDLVLNHSSAQHPWFQAARNGDPFYRDFYRWSATNPGYSGPWGQNVWHQNSNDVTHYYGIFWDQMPDLNFTNTAVKDSIVDIMDFWLNTVGVDGFRCDAVKYLYENGNQLEDQPQTFSYWQEFRAIMDSLKPGSMAVGEAWTNTANVVPYATNDRFNYCFEFDLANALQFGANVGDPLAISGQMNTVQSSYDSLQYGVFLSNHDQNRVFTNFQSDVAKMKAAAGIYLTLPGIPYVYYGEEVGMVGQGDHLNIRRPMQWNPTPPFAGFTTGTAWQGVPLGYVNYNVESLGADPQSLLNLYRKLINIRSREHALQYGEFKPLFTSIPGSVLAYERSGLTLNPIMDNPFIVVSNLGDTAISSVNIAVQSMIADAGTVLLYEVVEPVNSFVWSFDGGNVLEVTNLPAKTTRIYRVSYPSGLEEEDLKRWTPYPNPADHQIQVREGEAEEYAIYDALGRTVLEGELSMGALETLELPVGWYTLRLSNKGHSEVHKILIQH